MDKDIIGRKKIEKNQLTYAENSISTLINFTNISKNNSNGLSYYT